MILIPTGWNPEDTLFYTLKKKYSSHFSQDFELALEPSFLGSNGGLIFFFLVFWSLIALKSRKYK